MVKSLSSSNSQLQQYPVSVWEVVAVFSSAVFLVAAGTVGLGLKFAAHTFNPQRATAIARNIMDYQLSDRAQGVLGVNIASAKVAVVVDRLDNPDIQLLMARVPTNQATHQRQINAFLSQIEQFLDGISLGDAETGYTITTTQVETKKLCGTRVPVTVRSGRLATPEHSTTQLAVNYRASVTLNHNKFVVFLVTTGEDAPQKAATVFNSLRCKLNPA